MTTKRGIDGYRGATVAVVAVALGAAACSAPANETPGATCAPASVIVATSDYSSSGIGLLGLDGGAAFYRGGAALGADPVLASSRGRLFWIDRDLGRVLELGPRCANPLGEPWLANDADAGANSDPQDLAVAPDGTLWIARFNVPTILLKSSDGATALGTIDLSHVTPTARNPYMSSIRILDGAAGAKAYVTLEMLTEVTSGPKTGFASIDPSYLVRIDVASRRVEQTLQLKGRNPFGLMVEYEDPTGKAWLYLADAGDTQIATETDAGIERVDVEAFTSELLVRESDLGASVDQVAVTTGCGTAIVMGPGPENVTSLISFDPVTGELRTPLAKGLLYTDAGFELAGLAWLDGGVALVGDRTYGPKGFPVHALRASGSCTFTERPGPLFAAQQPVALQAVP